MSPTSACPGDFWRGLDADARERFSSLMSPVSFPGGVIFLEGSRCDEMFVIESGRIQLAMFVPGRGRVTILTLGPGDLLAWSAVTGEGVMTATAIATEPVTAQALRRDVLQRLSDTAPELALHLWRQISISLSSRLVATRLQLLDLYADTAPPESLDTEFGTAVGVSEIDSKSSRL